MVKVRLGLDQMGEDKMQTHHWQRILAATENIKL